VNELIPFCRNSLISFSPARWPEDRYGT